eukprot:scaffold46782_cov32-Tisochrysis_lutea.AAC.1
MHEAEHLPRAATRGLACTALHFTVVLAKTAVRVDGEANVRAPACGRVQCAQQIAAEDWLLLRRRGRRSSGHCSSASPPLSPSNETFTLSWVHTPTPTSFHTQERMVLCSGGLR